MKPLQFHSEVEPELEDAIEWYESRRAGLGREFRIEIEEVLQSIQSNPESAPRYPDTNHQFVLTKRFPYLICYLNLEDAIWITAVAHERRRPGYWLDREPE